MSRIGCHSVYCIDSGALQNNLKFLNTFLKGKWYFEGTVTDEGLCRVGWSTDQARLDLGTDKFGFGFGGTGKKSWNKQFDTYGEVSCQNWSHSWNVVGEISV